MQRMMKTLDDYMIMTYRMKIIDDKDEGGFAVYYSNLSECITYGVTLESAIANTIDEKRHDLSLH